MRNLIFILPFPLNKINAEDTEEGFHQKDSPEADGRRLGDLSAFQVDRAGGGERGVLQVLDMWGWEGREQGTNTVIAS